LHFLSKIKKFKCKYFFLIFHGATNRAFFLVALLIIGLNPLLYQFSITAAFSKDDK